MDTRVKRRTAQDFGQKKTRTTLRLEAISHVVVAMTCRIALFLVLEGFAAAIPAPLLGDAAAEYGPVRLNLSPTRSSRPMSGNSTCHYENPFRQMCQKGEMNITATGFLPGAECMARARAAQRAQACHAWCVQACRSVTRIESARSSMCALE